MEYANIRHRGRGERGKNLCPQQTNNTKDDDNDNENDDGDEDDLSKVGKDEKTKNSPR